jgi:ADP-ribosylglycohydrolase
MRKTIEWKLNNIQKQINKLKDARNIVQDVGQSTKTLDAVIIAMGRVLEYLVTDEEG